MVLLPLSYATVSNQLAGKNCFGTGKFRALIYNPVANRLGASIAYSGIRFSLVLCLLPFVVMAGANHEHDLGHDHNTHLHEPVSQSQAEAVAIKSIEKPVGKRKMASADGKAMVLEQSG